MTSFPTRPVPGDMMPVDGWVLARGLLAHVWGNGFFGGTHMVVATVDDLFVCVVTGDGLVVWLTLNRPLSELPRE